MSSANDNALSSANSCLDFLNNFASVLNSINTSNIGLSSRPHVVFFTEGDCTGTHWPPFGTPIEQTDTWNPNLDNPDTTLFAFGSAYIPAGYGVLFQSTTGDEYYVPPLEKARLIPDTRLIEGAYNPSFGRGILLYARVSDPVLARAIPVLGITQTQNPITEQMWKLLRCNQQVFGFLGSTALTGYENGSPECDSFMNAWCKASTGLQNHLDLPICACLKEEAQFMNTYCEPGNNSAACVSTENFAAVLPVTCFGKLCSVEGYRFRRMREQHCNTTLCEQVINIIGKNIIADENNVIWCGNGPHSGSSFSLNTVVNNSDTSTNINGLSLPNPNITDSSKNGSKASIPMWGWLAIAVAAILIFVALPIAWWTSNRKKPLKISTEKTNVSGNQTQPSLN